MEAPPYRVSLLLAGLVATAIAPRPAAAQDAAAAAAQVAAQAATQAAACEVVAPSVSSWMVERARIREVAGDQVKLPNGLTSISRLASVCAPSRTERLQLRTLPLALTGVFHSAYPLDRDNGFRWDGRGLNGELSGGIDVRAGRLRLILAPAAAYQQNRSFASIDTVFPTDLSPFSDPWQNRRIDQPTRFGDGAFTSVHLGQSSLTLSLGAVEAVAATENLVIGPGVRSQLLLANTAAGFPHGRVGTARPIRTALGEIEANVFWGRVAESDYFNSDPSDDHRLLTGFVLTLTPSWAPGLNLGAAGLNHSSLDGGLEAAQLLGFFHFPLENVGENDEDNGLTSVFFRWTLPESAFELWGEWARDDFAQSATDLLAEPGHSRAWLLGLQKVWPSADGAYVRALVETSSTQVPFTERAGRPEVHFYTHGTLRQGHTNQGQLLGSFIGTDADIQLLGVDVVDAAGGAWGGFVERIRRDADSYVRFFSADAGPSQHDVELRIGLRRMVDIGDWSVEADASLARRRNRGFVALDRPGALGDTETDAGLRLRLVWLP